ncbi:NUDIX hydrolase [Nakamurella multipartita]|uniref:NUDIX hydrolase n=1 Tax=Nakamurella multipartita (strain ATCC 700099 / DSM 44233 / CIP 104796 / JCM 9543 / NBRC 105858 / Y-104) TaxID=479431 RepID=C8XEZ4_NAKMY|nr:NUDIX hydrolase [Nakamurella multipartita]ACV77880.1 NUDIX hydrolase [Nakamurella multipartita DSM 44233]HOZ57421.1 NUDIX hydrolase [Nakamurella multipartita]
MASESAAVIRAAGAVLWKPSRRDGLRIALVHRPRYNDWSLPKGKAEHDEVPQVTAAREVEEETGFRAAIGRSLTTVSYTTSAGPKTVQYFAARRLGGFFAPNKEVDRLEWLSMDKARARMSYEFDRAVLSTFALEPAAQQGVLLVRHARAGQREAFVGDDALRPLDAKGRRQAAALVGELGVYAPTTVHSAPLERCRGTVAPLAEKLGTGVVPEKSLSEDAYRDDPAAARRRLVDLAVAQLPGETTVVCSQGGVIPGVVKSLATRDDVPVAGVSTPKAAYWFLSFDGRRLVQADPYPAPQV